MTLERVVVVGSSIAGVRAAQGLRDGGFTGDVVVIGEERDTPYDKPPLSKQVLAGTQDASDISLLGPDGWEGAGLTGLLGSAAVGLDTSARRVRLADGRALAYDALIVATGVRARTLSNQGPPLVHTVRELGDATRLRERLVNGGPVVVVGGGFIGAEVAASAKALGLHVTIVEALPTPFSRVLGAEVGQVMTQLHLDHGVGVTGGVSVTKLEELGDGSVLVHLSDGQRLEAATVVVGIGCLPNTEWLESSQVPVEDGVVTDEHCAVPGVDGVYAIGDVARWHDVRTGRHRRVEHWTSAVEQAHLVAHNLLHPDDVRTHDKAPYFWSDQHGVKIQMVGEITPRDHVEIFRFPGPKGDRTVAMYSHAGCFSAAVTFGWPRAAIACRQAWERGASPDDVLTTIRSLA